MEISATPENNTLSLQHCSICERTFNPLSLERHEKICEKNQRSRRQIFDSSLQRTKNITTIPDKTGKKVQNKKPNVKWKEHHEELLKTIRNGKCVTENENIMNNGFPSGKNIPSDYIQCPVCLRCFNYKAADRHISWCQEQQSRVPKSPPSFEALRQLKARVHYRPPPPGKKHFNVYCEPQRLIRSAESCKTPSVPRTYSSPGPLNRSGRSKQVAFQQELQIIPRRHSCERASVKKENNRSYDLNSYNSISTNKPSSFQKLIKNAVKFKETLPTYSNSRKTETFTQDFENVLFHNDNSNLESEENTDILSALRLQLAELKVSERLHRKDTTSSSTNNNDCLPAVSSSELASSLGVCNVLTCDGNDFRQSSSSGSDGSLPSMGRQKSSLPRMPRFCYQCGTKYPIMNAKYCCECGARRLILSNEND